MSGQSLRSLRVYLLRRFGVVALLQALVTTLFFWALAAYGVSPQGRGVWLFLGASLLLALAVYLLAGRIVVGRMSETFNSYADLARAIANGRSPEQWPQSTTVEFHRLVQVLREMSVAVREREQILRENEAREKATLDCAADAVVIADEHARVTRLNPAAEQLTGWCSAEVVGQPLATVFNVAGAEAQQELEDLNRALLAGHEVPGHREVMLRSKDGRKIRVSGSVAPIQRADGRATGLVWVIRDVTEASLQEQRLRESEQRLSMVLASSKEGIWDWNRVSGDVYFDDWYYLMAGYEPGEFPLNVEEWIRRLHVDDREAVTSEITRCIAGGDDEFRVEYRFRCKDDSYIYVRSMGRVMGRDASGQALRMVGANADITEQRNLEESLRLTQFTFEHANIAILRIAGDAKIIEANAAAATMLGYSTNEVEGLSLIDTDPVADEQRWKLVWQDLLNTGERHFKRQLRKKDGTLFPVDIYASVSRFKGEPYVIAYMRDVSERQELEESLRLTQFVFENAPIGIWRMDFDGRVVDVNAHGRNSLGYGHEELCSKSVFDIDPEMDRERWGKLVQGRPTNSAGTFESAHRRANGEIFPVEVVANHLRYQGKEYGVAFVSDITKRKEGERELHRLRNYLTNIIDSMPSVLIGVDSDAVVTQWNQTVEHYTGIPAERARGKPVGELLPWMASELDSIQRSIRTREVIRKQSKQRRLGSDVHYEDMTIYPLVANGVEGAVIRVDDVTEKVRLQDMMIQSEKMLSVGGLAAGMAHEINNPLAGLMQTVSVMSNRLTGQIDNAANVRAAEAAGTTTKAIAAFMEDRGIARMLNAIDESGRRVAEIVDNMLSFARKSDASNSSHNLNDLLDKVLQLARADYDLKRDFDFRQIEIVREYDDTLPEVPCEGSKIQQVLLNLLSNGAHAMADVDDRPPRFVLRTFVDHQNQLACVEVRDNGVGMDEATRKRVFEPFFTTKPPGVGTGLGLSVSYFIITETCGGCMSVESTLGAGSCFRIGLPLTPGASS